MRRLIRQEYIGSQPPKDDSKGFETLLYANENPINLAMQVIGKDELNKIFSLSFNRYPDCEAADLRSSYADYLGNGATINNIVAGNGSDEIIRAIGDVFLEVGETLISCEPAFSVYKRAASLAKGRYFGIVSTEPGYKPSVDNVIQQALIQDAKIIVICSPHNPIGYAWPEEDLIRLIDSTESLIVIDEAYIEFSERKSFFTYALNNDRVIVLRTMSKAFSLASLRIGFGISSPSNINALLCGVDMYNINSFSQALAIEMLKHSDELKLLINEIKEQRNLMYEKLLQLKIAKVFPSEANFIFMETDNADELEKKAADAGILIRGYGDKRHIRISIGTSDENERLIRALRGF